MIIKILNGTGKLLYLFKLCETIHHKQEFISMIPIKRNKTIVTCSINFMFI